MIPFSKSFADWCGACQLFGPVYEEAAAVLAKEFPDLKIAAVNVDEDTELAARFQIWSPAYERLSAESLVRAVREVKKTGQKWAGYLHPFGALATALALLGRASGSLSRFWRTLPWWSFWVVVAVLMGLTVWAVFLEDEPPRAALLEDRRGEAEEVDGGAPAAAASAAAGGIQAGAAARRRKKGEER
ncbi:MAG: hypothetical protein BJ554DRAFT_2173 [Olpidium bornovanus]|uniref:Thioredoxin domain-containing protein n=1 Tax=Olpidium bornovanus TaxID=278681 RepID=A0A8H7ZQE8_9FUNG|nr:MAG: hypothetical protein BJ554DRAFT_2173 [Olpidium bornovanus]